MSRLYQRARDIFESAIELRATEREAYLQQVCDGNDELYEIVRDLLAADEDTEHDVTAGLASGVVDVIENLETEFDLSQTLANYRFIEKIGQGGMGSVYKAERCDDVFHKIVAIKIMRQGFDSEDRMRRFQNERQILADLEHPQIARLLDGGTTSDGRPYVVVEYVDGKPLTRYADDDQLTIRQRLGLFNECCRVVQYAHDHLIVHRDIKPSNFLIDKQGNLKLLDFGIAKMLEDAQAHYNNQQTAPLARLLTPDYASPEQVLRKAITTISDVYSLGVLLYEILSGTRPFYANMMTPAEYEDALLHQTPTPPSHYFDGRKPAPLPTFDAEKIARARKVTTTQLGRQLRGDLDVIVLHALASNSKDRYRSAEELARDIDRYLNAQPIQARPHSLWYRFGKLVQRRTAFVATSITAIAVTIAFTIFTYVQAIELERERNQALAEKQRAESVTQFMVDTYESFDPGHARGRDISAREVIDKGVERLSNELASHPKLQFDLKLTMARVYINLGHYNEAENVLYDMIHAADEGEQEAVEVLTMSLRLLASVLIRQGGYAKAIEAVERARLIDPEKALQPLTMAEDLMMLGKARANLQQLTDSRDSYNEALILYQQQLGPYHFKTASALNALAGVLRWLDDDERAVSLYRQAIMALTTHYDRDHPDLARSMLALANTYRSDNELEKAEEQALNALAMMQRLFREPHPDTASALNAMGLIAKKQGQYAQSADYFQRSVELKTQILGSNHPSVAISYFNLGTLRHRYLLDLPAAEDSLRKTVAIASETWDEQHINMTIFRAGLAFVLKDADQLDEAEDLLRVCIERIANHAGEGEQAANLAKIRSELASLMFKRGRYGEARRLIQLSLPVLIEEYGEDDLDTQRALQYQQDIDAML